MSSSTPSESGVRWGLVATVTVVGILVTGAPYVLAGFLDERFGEWRVLLSGTLTSVGTILLLVAAVWLLERKFAARITSAVQETTRATVAEETSDLVASQREMSVRLDDLQARLDERTAAATRAQDQVIQRLQEGVSFESVREALAQADGLGALWFHSVTVPCGDGDPALPRFEIRWGTVEKSAYPFSVDQLANDDDGPSLTITHPADLPNGERVRVDWSASNTADEVLAELAAGMIAAGDAEHAKAIDASIFENLHAALHEAVIGRRKDAGAWLQGSLDEWVSSEWAITSWGLEHRGPHSMPSSAFPLDWNGRSNVEAVQWKKPPAPEGIDSNLWNFLIQRARRHHRQGASPFR